MTVQIYVLFQIQYLLSIISTFKIEPINQSLAELQIISMFKSYI